MSGTETKKTPEDVIAWMAPDGPVTTLEVDAVRSVANALIQTLPDSRDGRLLKGYMLGLARDDDASIAEMVHHGRMVRTSAGDAPLIASFDMSPKQEPT